MLHGWTWRRFAVVLALGSGCGARTAPEADTQDGSPEGSCDLDTRWTSEHVDDGATYNYTLAMMVDPDGMQRIGYMARGSVVLASRSSPEWELQDVTWGDTFTLPAFGTDPEGSLHVAWAQDSDRGRNIMYAYSDGADWHEERIDDGQRPLLAVDPMGVPHVLYSAATGRLLASKQGRRWVIEPLPDIGILTDSLVADEDGNLHVAIDASGNVGKPFRGLAYASNASGTWTVEHAWTTGEDAIVGRIALAVDARGFAHVALTRVRGDIYYVTNIDGGWRASRVTSTFGGTFDSIALAVEEDDTVHLIWHDRRTDPAVTSDLRHGTLSGSEWQFETIEDVDDRLITSLALANGTLHLAYANWVQGDVRYLYRRVSCR